MKTLKHFMKKDFALDLDQLLPRDTELVSLTKNSIDDTYLVGSPAAQDGAFLVQADIVAFLRECPPGYFLFGHWGHGVNSYALYYSRVDEWSRVLFRLPYGGVYMDNDDAARRIRRFLLSFFDFERSVRTEAAELIAVHSMGESFFRMAMKTGRAAEVRSPLFPDADPAVFDELLRRVR